MLLPLVGLAVALALIVAGVALVSVPAALIVAGVLLGAVSALYVELDRSKPRGGSA